MNRRGCLITECRHPSGSAHCSRALEGNRLAIPGGRVRLLPRPRCRLSWPGSTGRWIDQGCQLLNRQDATKTNVSVALVEHQSFAERSAAVLGAALDHQLERPGLGTWPGGVVDRLARELAIEL